MTPTFTVDWFSGAAPHCSKTLQDVCPTNILEIGSFEGRSAVWFLTQYPDARLICVDTFEGSEEHHQAGMDMSAVETRFQHNIAPFGNRVTVRKGHSSKVLYGLEPESFDCIYVDGSHTEDDTLVDIVLAYGLLRKGGAMLIDDYAQSAFPGVKKAADHIEHVFGGKLRCVYRGYQVHFIKDA